MSGGTDLTRLLADLRPVLAPGEFVFCCVPAGRYEQLASAEVLAMCREEEGVTLVLDRQGADQLGLDYEGSYRRITLGVHSSLEAVGLTAAVSSRLAERGIAANVMAAYYHDHVFVPTVRAEEALKLLEGLASETGNPG